jgi:hypothetical protein
MFMSFNLTGEKYDFALVPNSIAGSIDNSFSEKPVSLIQRTTYESFIIVPVLLYFSQFIWTKLVLK